MKGPGLKLLLFLRILHNARAAGCLNSSESGHIWARDKPLQRAATQAVAVNLAGLELELASAATLVQPSQTPRVSLYLTETLGSIFESAGPVPTVTWSLSLELPLFPPLAPGPKGRILHANQASHLDGLRLQGPRVFFEPQRKVG